MPSRNVIKQNVANSYYHVYARGASKQAIFLCAEDYRFFEKLFARYLSRSPQTSAYGPYPHLRDKVSLASYCLMPNHFHLLLYQTEQDAMSLLMRSVMTSYSHYFNHKYQRTGSMFESRYKASRIVTPMYLEHISRYIHLNPRYWRRYPYSSMRCFTQGGEPEWLENSRILDMFSNRAAYTDFVADYEAQKRVQDEIKYELADR